MTPSNQPSSNELPKVLVIGGDHLVVKLFEKVGWPIAGDEDSPDVIVFTGGADVGPQLYGQDKHPTTRTDDKRDEEEVTKYWEFHDAFKIGICRGAQFLNVMNDGELWQNVDQHTQNHPALYLPTGEIVEVTSTHHQMMRPGKDSEVLMTCRRSKLREDGRVSLMGDFFTDVEAVWYPKTKSLCFQPHPEYSHKPTEDIFWRLFEFVCNRTKEEGK